MIYIKEIFDNGKLGDFTSDSGIAESLNFTITKSETEIKQSDINGQWYLIENCPMKTEEDLASEERARINMLSLTAADVERAIYKAKGIDFEDIIKQLSSYAAEQLGDLDLKALKIELKANNFYRGNPYVTKIGAILGFTSEDLDYLFEHGELPEGTDDVGVV